jgi:hypothetical protein
MPNFLIKLTIDFIIGIIVGTVITVLCIKAKTTLNEYKNRKILYDENTKLRREKKELESMVLQNQHDIKFLKEEQEDCKFISLQCLELLGELTHFRDSESLNSTYAATIRFKEKFKPKSD